MQKGTTHTDAARLAIAVGVRARAQERRERASLVVAAIDHAFTCVEAVYALGPDVPEEEAERIFETAALAVASARRLTREETA